MSVGRDACKPERGRAYEEERTKEVEPVVKSGGEVETSWEDVKRVLGCG